MSLRGKQTAEFDANDARLLLSSGQCKILFVARQYGMEHRKDRHGLWHYRVPFLRSVQRDSVTGLIKRDLIHCVESGATWTDYRLTDKGKAVVAVFEHERGFQKQMTKHYPLRQVVQRVKRPILNVAGEETGVERIQELLECGHVIPVRQDIFGETNAYNRRCKACFLGEDP
jgi:hypothetical protein